MTIFLHFRHAMTYNMSMKNTTAKLTDRGFLVTSLSVKARRHMEMVNELGHEASDLDTLLAELCDGHAILGEIAEKHNWNRIVSDVRKGMKMSGVKNV